MFQSLLVFLSDDPALRILQLLLLILGIIDVFLIFFTLRDILLRSRSFGLQMLSLALVALLPILGFFLYLLVRPARTVRDRELDAMLLEMHDHLLRSGKAKAKHHHEESKSDD